MSKIPPQFKSNIAKVKAAQDPNKPGAEKPDLGAQGKKQAAVEELRQPVGIEPPADWQKPDVRVEGQTTDMIDDSYLRWMREKADEDRVKVAVSNEDIARSLVSNPTIENMAKALKSRHLKGQLAGAAKALVGTGALAGAAYGGHRLAKRTGVQDPNDQYKQAAFVENPDNVSLLEKLRQKAAKMTE